MSHHSPTHAEDRLQILFGILQIAHMSPEDKRQWIIDNPANLNQHVPDKQDRALLNTFARGVFAKPKKANKSDGAAAARSASPKRKPAAASAVLESSAAAAAAVPAPAAAAAAAAGTFPEEPEMCRANQCIPYAFKEDGSKENCAKTYQNDNCFPPTAVEMEFYEKINWPELMRIIDVEMKSFMNLLNGLYINDIDGFAHLVNLVYPGNTHQQGIVARVGDKKNELFFKAVDLVNKDQHKCNDVNYSFSIECQRYHGGPRIPPVSEGDRREFRLFHIAIHSEMPKYHKKEDGQTRSKYACGYFERKSPSGKDAQLYKLATAGAVAAGVEGSGPFHYKIDNYDILPTTALISNNQCGVKIDEIICPFKRFELEIDDFGYATGKFQVLHPHNVGFVNLFAEWSIPAITSFSPRFQKKDILQQRFAHLHSYIYNKFVTFWNDEIFPKVVNSQRVQSEAVHKLIPEKMSTKKYLDSIRPMIDKMVLKSVGIYTKKYIDSIRSTAANVVSKMVVDSVRHYTSKGRGGSRKRDAKKRRLTKKMKNSRRRVKK